VASWDDTNVKPYPKSRQLARGDRRYRRKIASPKQWQAIIASKGRSCRCLRPTSLCESWIEYHHVVARDHDGDDVADNIVPVCHRHHMAITARWPEVVKTLLANLSDAEYAYMIQRGGEDYPERAYGIRYTR
jgi:hypothetical protein